MKKYIKYILGLSSVILIISCNDYVQNVDPYIDRVKDEDLNIQDEFKFLIRGVQQRFATASDQLAVLAGGLSDEMFFTYDVQGASYDTFYDIDQGNIELDNTSSSDAYDALGEAFFFANDLIRRAGVVSLDESTRDRALYIGNLYGGIARTLYADYFGLTQSQGGSPINVSPFINSSALYDSAIVCFTKAIEYASSDYEIRVINSLIARAYLFQAEYTNNYQIVQTSATGGMIINDPPFEALYHDEYPHAWYYYSGRGRTQFTLNTRFIDYIEADSTEVNRMPVFSEIGWDDNTYWFQDKYPERDSPIAFITWQENHLMQAELSLRSSDTSAALYLINEVRFSHGITQLSAVSMNTLIEERDKELMCTGSRLMDQRRFNIWHLSNDLWRYLPISLNERNINPYIE